MKFYCPECRKEFDFLDVQGDQDVVAIVKMMPVFGKHGNLVWAYLELFGISPISARRKKVRVLLEEMAALFRAEKFTYKKKEYKITPAGILEALNLTVHKHFETPLQNHNYLKLVMIDVAGKENKDAGREAEKDLRSREDRLRSGSRDGAPASIDREANLKRVGALLEKFK